MWARASPCAGQGSEKGRLKVQKNNGGEEGPDRCREGQVSRERRQSGILCRIGDPVVRGRTSQFPQEDLPPVVAWLIQETAAEFEVLSMRAERSTWELSHAVFATARFREHLGHAGAIGTAKVEGDMDSITWDVLQVAAIKPRAVGMCHLTATGSLVGCSSAT